MHAAAADNTATRQLPALLLCCGKNATRALLLLAMQHPGQHRCWHVPLLLTPARHGMGSTLAEHPSLHDPAAVPACCYNAAGRANGH